MREDISGEDYQRGSRRVYCDAPGCSEYAEGRPQLGEDWPEGWTQDLRRTPMTTGTVRDYCPRHAGLASA